AERAQDGLAVRIVRQCVQQMFEGDVGVPAGQSLAIGDREDDFKRCGEHGYPSSSAARRGYPASRAIDVTVSTFVSATSQGYTPAIPRPFRCTCIMTRYASAGGLCYNDSRTWTEKRMVWD